MKYLLLGTLVALVATVALSSPTGQRDKPPQGPTPCKFRQGNVEVNITRCEPGYECNVVVTDPLVANLPITLYMCNGPTPTGSPPTGSRPPPPAGLPPMGKLPSGASPQGPAPCKITQGNVEITVTRCESGYQCNVAVTDAVAANLPFTVYMCNGPTPTGSPPTGSRPSAPAGSPPMGKLPFDLQGPKPCKISQGNVEINVTRCESGYQCNVVVTDAVAANLPFTVYKCNGPTPTGSPPTGSRPPPPTGSPPMGKLPPGQPPKGDSDRSRSPPPSNPRGGPQRGRTG